MGNNEFAVANFNGRGDQADKLMRLFPGANFMVSPAIARDDRASTRAALARIPLERILAQSGSPLAHHAEHQNTPNLIHMCSTAVAHIGFLKGINAGEAIRITKENTYRFFRINLGGGV